MRDQGLNSHPRLNDGGAAESDAQKARLHFPDACVSSFL